MSKIKTAKGVERAIKKIFSYSPYDENHPVKTEDGKFICSCEKKKTHDRLYQYNFCRECIIDSQLFKHKGES